MWCVWIRLTHTWSFFSSAPAIINRACIFSPFASTLWTRTLLRIRWSWRFSWSSSCFGSPCVRMTVRSFQTGMLCTGTARIPGKKHLTASGSAWESSLTCYCRVMTGSNSLKLYLYLYKYTGDSSIRETCGPLGKNWLFKTTIIPILTDFIYIYIYIYKYL